MKNQYGRQRKKTKAQMDKEYRERRAEATYCSYQAENNSKGTR